jgi:hypothetical protein
MDCKLVDGDKLAKFFVVEILLEENENLLQKTIYFEKIGPMFEDVEWVAYVVKDTIYMW